MIAPRHLIFTGTEHTLTDSRTGSSAESEEALSELDRRKIPLIFVSSSTRAELEPLRRELGHNHPFITENGGAIFFPDGYFNVRIQGVQRTGRYLAVHLGRSYAEVCTALDDIAADSGAGVAGFHHMNTREVAENTGLRPREAELARSREFEEPFYFTSGDERVIARFVELAKERGFTVRSGEPFWYLSAGAEPAQAVRFLTKLFREATRIKLRSVGIGSTINDVAWLRAVDHATLLPNKETEAMDSAIRKNIALAEQPGGAGWSATILNTIS